jgi:hypothetical protein
MSRQSSGLLLVALATLCAGATPAVAQGSNPCAQVTPVLLQAPPNLVMPSDFVVPSQINADCMAWQEFFYLNWGADPANPGSPNPGLPVSAFGKPGDLNNTVWESFLSATQVFNPPGNRALAWNSKRPTLKDLSRRSKLGDAQVDLGAIQQAGSDSWLTDQSGNLVFYEVRLNQDEYAFITSGAQESLTTFAGQSDCAGNPGQGGNGGFNLPAGGGNTGKNLDYDCSGNIKPFGQNLGAIEVKAAWRVLPANGSLNYRYKIASATLHLPDGTIQQATVGLIGLHIIHKVPSGPQFIWATFEQIDNDPDATNPPSEPILPPHAPITKAPYTLFNPNCSPSTDRIYGCKQNATVVTSPPPASPLPPCPVGSYTPGKCYPYWAPMQITRLVPVKNLANSVTAYAWSQLPAGSVFNYYRLIDVQWPSAPAQIAPGARAPLTAGGITPASNSYILANTTLETFMQSRLSCMDCHQHAGIAQPTTQTLAGLKGHQVRRVLVTPGAPRGSTAAFASDYSFLFSTETQH